LCCGLRQFGEDQSAVAGEGTATEAERNGRRSGASLSDGKNLAVHAEFARRTIGVQDDFVLKWMKREFRQDMIVQKFNAIEQGQFLPADFIFIVEIVSACANRMCAGSGVEEDRDSSAI